MPADDLVLNVRQIENYPPAGSALASDALLIQRGGLGGSYLSIAAQQLVATGLVGAGTLPLQVGDAAPWDADGSQVFANGFVTPLDGFWLWNAYAQTGTNATVRLSAGSAGWMRFDQYAGWKFSWADAGGGSTPVTGWTEQLTISPSGYLTVGEQVALGRDPAAPMEAATAQWVQATFATSRAMLESLYASATVWSFNSRVGNIILNVNDVMSAGGAPIYSPNFQGQPTAPNPSPADNSGSIATTAWVWQNVNSHIAASAVTSFNTRTGAVTLTTSDITAAGGATTANLSSYAPLASPAFSGNATAPTPPPGNATGQIATTAFVMAAVSAGTAGVSSFNARTGAVVLTQADITGAGGAILASPVFTGTPTGPTAAPGTSTQQLATTAFVLSANVTSFNTRIGAITLMAADITGAGGAVLASPAFTGSPTAPTAAPGTNTGQIATTAFVANVIAGGLVQTFNGRSGAVSLIANDISAAGGAVLAGPAFTGVPTAPTATPGTNTTQLATTAYVTAALAVAGGVSSFNGRAGVVTFQASDITGVGGALLASPALTGTPTAPTATAGTATTQLATTQFVGAAITAAGGVSSFNTRTGAVVLTAADLNGAGGPFLPIAGGNLTGGLTGTTAQFSGVISPNTAKGIAGTIYGDNVQAGSIGEDLESVVTAGTAMTSGATAAVTSLTLSAGDWDVNGEVWLATGTGGATLLQAGIIAGSVLPGNPGIGAAKNVMAATFPASSTLVLPLQTTRINVTASTVVNLLANASFPSGTCYCYGSLRARRAR